MRSASMVLAVVVVLGASRSATADPAADVKAAYTAFVEAVAAGKPTPDLEMFITPKREEDPVPEDLAAVRKLVPKPKVTTLKVVIAKGGRAAWIAAEIAARVPHDGKVKDEALRASGFLVKDDKGWHVKAAHWSIAVPNQIAEMCGMIDDWQIPSSVPPALEAPVRAVLESLDAPAKGKGFVTLLSDDANAQVFGSAPKEKFVGGKKIKGVFKKWDVSLGYWDKEQPTLPSRAGAGPDNDLMWMAVSITGPWKLCASYRTLFVLANEKAGWRIVHHHYSESVYLE